MSLDADDEFWNRSNVKAMSFDDEDQLITAQANQSGNIAAAETATDNASPGTKTLHDILAARPSSSEPFLKPSIIMCNADRIEELIIFTEDNFVNPQLPAPKVDPKTYIKNIIDKRVPIDFSAYKSKQDKLLLLDSAICYSDGNTITAATIHLSKTLKQSLFINELKRRPIAIDHYINYLELTGRSRDAMDLLKTLSVQH